MKVNVSPRRDESNELGKSCAVISVSSLSEAFPYPDPAYRLTQQNKFAPLPYAAAHPNLLLATVQKP
jgi:hypothetical protein